MASEIKTRRYCWRELRYLPGCERCKDAEGVELADKVAGLIEVIRLRNCDAKIGDAAAEVASFLEQRYCDA